MSNLNRHPVRRTAAGVLASALAFSGAFAAATPANAAAGFRLDRIAGVDRYDTSAQTAAAFDAAATVTNVILASGENGRAADALGASFLAGVRGAPVLLTAQAALPATTRAALTTLRTNGATSVTIVGGPTAVSNAVQTEVTALGFTVNRLAGQDRFGTAEAVVAAGEGAAASNVGIVASGISTVDALAVGPLAYKGKHPIFLTRAAALPASTIAAMRTAGVTSVYIVGGEAVVSAAVRTQLTAAGITVVNRLAGQTRSGTSVAIADAIIGGTFGFTNTTFNVASGANDGVDALSGAALSGLQNRALLVTDTATNAGAVIGFATARAATLNEPGIIFGGTAAVSEAVETAIETAAGGTTGAGPVTLAATSAAAGSAFTGTLADPGTVSSVSVSGCGFSNQSVSVGASGGFSLSLPAAQTVGACPLVFTVLRTDGTSTTQTINFTVTAAPASTTAAPDLLSAAVNAASGVVTYTFDQPVTGAIADPADFYVYNAAGTRSAATNASASGSTVIAQFTTGQATGATLAAVGDAAVTGQAGRPTYAASVPLGVQSSTAGRTAGPDLESVNRVRVENGLIVGDFRFDEPVARSGEGAGATLTNGVVGNFELIASDGTTFPGGSVAAISADGRTITVVFQGTSQVPISSLVRGVALAGAVVGEDVADPNPTQTEPRTLVAGATPAETAFAGGAAADVTTNPDLTSVAVAGTNVVAFTFDEAVQANPVGGEVATFADFFVYNAAGQETAGTSAVRVSGNASVVNVTFPAGAVAAAVGAGVDDAAVAATRSTVNTTFFNQTHERPLQNITNTAGRTALPDLVSVAITTDAFGANTVVYTFDQAIGATEADALLITGAQFGLIDANGIRFTPAGAGALLPSSTVASNVTQGRLNSGRTTVTFTGSGGFTNAQAAAAVIGNDEDVTAATADVTTGDVPVRR